MVLKSAWTKAIYAGPVPGGVLKSAIKFIDPKIGRHPGEGRGPELTMDPGLRRD